MDIHTSDQRRHIRAAAILGALAVALGALGAHGLKARLTADQLNAFETGARYHLIHAVVLLVTIFMYAHTGNRFTSYARIFFFWGIILFSGSLYLLAVRELLGMEWLRWLGPVTPIGGLCLIAGWICLFFSALNKR
jgi:uncharacterized membrane protein YgdD (TMEM256/DUF423 family)